MFASFMLAAFNWNWDALIQGIAPVIVGWLFGILGVGPPKVTPNRLVNKP